MDDKILDYFKRLIDINVETGRLHERSKALTEQGKWAEAAECVDQIGALMMKLADFMREIEHERKA